jgi:hypothetical protein
MPYWVNAAGSKPYGRAHHAIRPKNEREYRFVPTPYGKMGKQDTGKSPSLCSRWRDIRRCDARCAHKLPAVTATQTTVRYDTRKTYWHNTPTRRSWLCCVPQPSQCGIRVSICMPLMVRYKEMRRQVRSQTPGGDCYADYRKICCTEDILDSQPGQCGIRVSMCMPQAIRI